MSARACLLLTCLALFAAASCTSSGGPGGEDYSGDWDLVARNPGGLEQRWVLSLERSADVSYSSAYEGGGNTRDLAEFAVLPDGRVSLSIGFMPYYSEFTGYLHSEGLVVGDGTFHGRGGPSSDGTGPQTFWMQRR
jgi:hypothetical protein